MLQREARGRKRSSARPSVLSQSVMQDNARNLPSRWMKILVGEKRGELAELLPVAVLKWNLLPARGPLEAWAPT